jgi:hypothetical protein
LQTQTKNSTQTKEKQYLESIKLKEVQNKQHEWELDAWWGR